MMKIDKPVLLIQHSSSTAPWIWISQQASVGQMASPFESCLWAISAWNFGGLPTQAMQSWENFNQVTDITEN